MKYRAVRWLGVTLLVGLPTALILATVYYAGGPPPVAARPPTRDYQPRLPMDTSGFSVVGSMMPAWPPQTTLEEIGKLWPGAGYRNIEFLRARGPVENGPLHMRVQPLLWKAALLNYEGEPEQAYEVLSQLRTELEPNDALASEWLYSVIFFQGVTAMRCGENDNCILCRGESSCIIPIAPAAVHTNPQGSRRAVRHFMEYLGEFPDDLGVRWLLNLAHMTLGEHPDQVDPRFLVTWENPRESEFGIGEFQDVGERVGVNRLNHAGGAIMDDFDNDGLLDIVTTSYDPAQSMALFRNNGEGTFDESTAASGLSDQLGGLYCVQADYNNDGLLDIYIPRGAWLLSPIRPTLLRNNGDGTFSDATEEARLLHPVNSNSASWCDYDNDGNIDLFVCCERQPNQLFRNRGDGTFEEVAEAAGVMGNGTPFCKGAAWFDFDNDGDSDLFLTYFGGAAQMFRNAGNGAFEEVTAELGVDGPMIGFACWAWDYNNDGWLDIFATSYETEVDDVAKGLIDQPHSSHTSRLFRNRQGRGFEDQTQEAGLDAVYATMGSNFGDFDNDGFLDMYLGTGDPGLETLVPNRMFRNIGGQRFADITSSSRTGHLQKGHGVACGDWDRDGNVDVFIEMGGAAPGDRFHNVLFQNPGHPNDWLTLRLVGEESNRSAIGARVKLVTAGSEPLTIHRQITSGSSFGANPLQQTIGLGKTDRIELLEIHWPTSGTTQVFRDIAVNQPIEVREFAADYRRLDWKTIPLPEPRPELTN